MPNRARSISQFSAFLTLAGFALGDGISTAARGASYASGVTISGTSVSFILNEPADLLRISVNGGPAITLDGSSKGLKTFNLGSASDIFSITATKSDSIGFTIPTGDTIAVVANGLSVVSPAGGARLISNDSDSLVRFNSPRGVTVATSPTNPQFGTAYISNSAVGTTTGVVRSVGDGLYALKADQSDAFGNGNTAVSTGIETGTASASSPFRVSVGSDSNVYIADFSDAYGSVYRMSPTLMNSTQVLGAIGGPSPVPTGQNHGSTTAVIVTGNSTGTTLYTLDEDLTSSNVGGASTTDRNSLWKYDIGTATQFTGFPTKVNTAAGGALVPLATSDLDRGANGNFYLNQFRSAGNEAGVIVLSSDGSTVLFNSLTESRTLLNDPAAVDILRNVQGIAVSPDQKYLAGIINNSDVVVLRLDGNGIPNLSSRLVIDTGTDIISGRDIAFDAAGNIHYVSSGQALYRILAPGGFTSATTSWNGSNFSFVLVPEPSTGLLLLCAGALGLVRRRRR